MYPDVAGSSGLTPRIRVFRCLYYTGCVKRFRLSVDVADGVVLATYYAVRRGVVPPGFSQPAFLLLNNFEVGLFAVYVAWGIAARYNKPVHKRLMLLATLGLMGPAISRWPLQMIAEKPQTIGLFFFIEVLSVLVFDLVTRHKPYWQTVVATLGIVALKPLADGLSETPMVQHLLNWVLHG